MSSELRVPTHATDAEVHCADGRVFVGRIFIPEASSHHSGAMRTDEWFNEGGSFFAFLPDEAKSTVVLNKRQVAVLTVPAPMDEAAPDGDPPLKRRVVLELVDRRVEGQIAIEMPLGQRRILDVLNCAEPFLVVRAGDRWHLVRKTLITRVVEIQEG